MWNSLLGDAGQNRKYGDGDHRYGDSEGTGAGDGGGYEFNEPSPCGDGDGFGDSQGSGYCFNYTPECIITYLASVDLIRSPT